MPPSTERLWELLRENPHLRGFVLIGGTALAQQLGHRLSEDLDFTWPGQTLPRRHVQALQRDLEQAGWTLNPNPSPALLAEFEDSGLEWQDYQQDFVANDPAGGSVKLTFVKAERENQMQLDQVSSGLSGPRVATVEEIFRLKCIAAADRSKSRDWLDLYLLLKDGRFGPLDFLAAFERAGVPSKLTIALNRLTSGKLAATDEGFQALLPDAPSLEEIRLFFVDFNDRVQQAQAQRIFGEEEEPSSRPPRP